MEAPELTIRAATQGDAQPVCDLWTEAFVEDPSGSRIEPYDEEEFRASARVGVVLVAERRGEVVGAVALFGNESWNIAEPGEAEVGRLGVALAARRGRVGTELLGRCHEEARRRGLGAVVLWTRPAQVAGHRLYESLGYLRAPDRDRADEAGPRLVYRIELGEPRRAG